MWLEDFTPEIESSEWAWQSSEATKEASEKYKESSKKAWAKIAKTGKDEKKARKYDFLLAWFLVKIIVDKKYDFILDTLFPASASGYPSNFILWILSLIHTEISNKIRDHSNKETIIFDYKTKNETIEFDDNNIDPKIKDRINYWVEDIVDSISIEYSNIQTEKLKELLDTKREIITNYSKIVFIFFLKEINISIPENKAENIIEFIISEVEKNINNLKIEKI